MTCKCGSNRILDFHCKHSDMFTIGIPHLDFEEHGNNPIHNRVFSSDYLTLKVCMDCGTIQNWDPIADEDVVNDGGF